MYGDFPAKNTVYTPYLPMNVWFWPTLHNRYACSNQHEARGRGSDMMVTVECANGTALLDFN